MKFIRFYYNNAASNLNDAINCKGVATGAMRMQMPATVNAGADARCEAGFVGAANASPAQVWDEAYGKNLLLRPLPCATFLVLPSASNGAVNGTTPDTLYTTGTPLGYDALDGKLPDNEYSGYVTYRFKVDQPNFEVQKQVSLAAVKIAMPGKSLPHQMAKLMQSSTKTLDQ